MNILFTICGRAGSKGVKNKNLLDFCGYPLPYYSLAAIDLYQKTVVNLSDIYIDIVINSDSSELLKMMHANPFTQLNLIERTSELSGDNVPKISVIYDSLKKMEEKKAVKYDMVVDFDITSPLRKVLDIDNLVQTHIKTGADITTSVTEARRNPYFNMLKKTDCGYKKVNESNFTARQQAPEIFDMNASLYAYKPEFLASGRAILDGYCECILMRDTGILDLDHENDFELMQVIAEYLFRTDAEYARIRNHIKERF